LITEFNAKETFVAMAGDRDSLINDFTLEVPLLLAIFYYALIRQQRSQRLAGKYGLFTKTPSSFDLGFSE